MEFFNIDEISPHPKNSYFFDDVEGEKWEEFLESIKTRGVIEPVILTQDKVIVSGHQRVRACKELGIDKVLCDIRHYDNDDDVILDLLDTNEKQRGTIGGSTIKLGRRIKEYERIYGVENGRNQHSEAFNNVETLTQDDLFAKLGIDRGAYHNAKRLASLPQEYQDMVETGRMSASTASRVIASLPDDEQIELLLRIPATGKITQKEVQKLVDKNKELESENNELNDKITELDSKLENQKPEKIRVIPDDYESLKQANKDLKKANEASKKDYRILENDRKKDLEKIKELKQRVQDLESRNDLSELQKKLEEEAGYFAIRTYDYIQKNAGYVWISEKINDLPDKLRKEFINAIYAIDAFSKQMVENIGGYGIE